MNPSLTITVPVYQEAENIERMIRKLEECVTEPHRLSIVYDREDDNTLPVVRKLMPEFPNIVLLQNCQGNGKGVINAIKTGFYEDNAAFVCLVCGDCTDQPEAITPMFKLALAGNDLVSGTRYSKGGKKVGGPWFQTQLSRWGNWWFGALTGLPLSDPTYSFRIYSRRLLDSVTIETEGGWAISLELSIKAHLAGFSMTEIGTLWLDRELGESKFRLAGWFPVYLKLFLWGVWKINVKRFRGERRKAKNNR
jgi:dolichol-phosphate mannosyltransferase